MIINLTQIATSLISDLGYSGLGVGLFVDSFGLPIPSEILVPLSVVLATKGRFNLWVVLFIATLAQVLGGLVAYYIGRYGGEPFLERYGKYFLITKRDLAKTHKAFERYGRWIVMIGRCVPGVRGLVGYSAGVAEMRLGAFVVFTTLGSAAWTLILAGLGFLIGDHEAIFDRLAGSFSAVGILLVVGLVAWHFRHWWWPKLKGNND